MITAQSLPELQQQNNLRDVVVACGVFDGVHRGHQRILAALRELAERHQATPVVMTFEPHPRQVLHPDSVSPPRLTSNEHKIQLLARCGVEAVVILPFTPELSRESPTTFLRRQLHPPGVRLHGICVGANWRFGDRGRGDVNFLEQAGAREKFEVISIPELLWYGKPISSTRIRQAITHGKLDTARKMLDRPYAVTGRVVHGKGIGKEKLKCPTANLMLTNQLLPPNGVYAARAALDPEKHEGLRIMRDGIAYIGHAPTIAGPAGTQPILEFHFFELDKDLYDHQLLVEFISFIRSDQKFPSVDALAAQLHRDIASAKRKLSLPPLPAM